jgi:polysaccharide pyruvyl transferase WcaK-like protein
MVTLKVLHLASFSGNMGDNANHRGIRKIFNKYLNFNMTYDELEIREFYISWGKRFFDSSFADLVNDYDLLIIGGGNFFDLYLDKSVTGTTINMTEQILQKIKTPIVFFGVGFDPYKGITDELINRFKRFLDNLLESEKVFISLRNDGSVENIKKYIGEEYVKYICKVPDGGFYGSKQFTASGASVQCEANSNKCCR